MMDAERLEYEKEDEEDKNREMLFKSKLIFNKKSYKEADFPEYSIHTDYKTLQHEYDSTVKKLSVDSTVDSYKTYLMGGFLVVEYLFRFIFKI